MITAKDFRKVLNAPEFKGFDVSINRNGTIEIKVSNRNTNYIYNPYGIIYYIGYRCDYDGYWVRQRNGEYIWPMNRNSNIPQDKYWFNTFDDALDYLKKHFNKKFGKRVNAVEDEALVVDFSLITDIELTPEQKKLMYANGIAILNDTVAVAISKKAKCALTDFTLELCGTDEGLDEMFPGIDKYIDDSFGAFDYSALKK